MLGVTRAIWEGAASVSGTIGRRPVSGMARLELQGYGCVFDLRTLQQDLTERIDRRIAEYLPRTIDETHVRTYVGDSPWAHEVPAFTAVLSRPVWDLLGRGGKHWRPIFGLLLLEALGVRSRPFELLVSILSELTHTGALIIDDIEDRADARRGAESIHVRYGLDVAINAANTLYSFRTSCCAGTRASRSRSGWTCTGSSASSVSARISARARTSTGRGC